MVGETEDEGASSSPEAAYMGNAQTRLWLHHVCQTLFLLNGVNASHVMRSPCRARAATRSYKYRGRPHRCFLHPQPHSAFATVKPPPPPPHYISNGPHQANRPQVHRWQGAPQAARCQVPGSQDRCCTSLPHLSGLANSSTYDDATWPCRRQPAV